MLKKIVLPLLLIFASTSLFGFQVLNIDEIGSNYASIYVKYKGSLQIRIYKKSDFIGSYRDDFFSALQQEISSVILQDHPILPVGFVYNQEYTNTDPIGYSFRELEASTDYIAVAVNEIKNKNDDKDKKEEEEDKHPKIYNVVYMIPFRTLQNIFNTTEHIEVQEENGFNGECIIINRYRGQTEQENNLFFNYEHPPTHRRNHQTHRLLQQSESSELVYLQYRVNGRIIKSYNKEELNAVKEKPQKLIFTLKSIGTYIFQRVAKYKDNSIYFFPRDTVNVTDKPATLYTDANEKGSSSDLVLGKTSLVPNNNTASSIRVFPNYEAILYTEQNFKGTTKSYRNTTNNKCKSLADGFNQGKEDITGVLNNTTSSVWVRKIPNAVNFYSEKDYQSGATLPYNFRDGKYNAIQMIEKGHSTIKSVRIPPQWRIKIYQNNTATEWLYGDQNLTKAYHFNNSSSYVQIEFNPIYNK